MTEKGAPPPKGPDADPHGTAPTGRPPSGSQGRLPPGVPTGPTSTKLLLASRIPSINDHRQRLKEKSKRQRVDLDEISPEDFEERKVGQLALLAKACGSYGMPLNATLAHKAENYVRAIEEAIKRREAFASLVVDVLNAVLRDDMAEVALAGQINGNFFPRAVITWLHLRINEPSPPESEANPRYNTYLAIIRIIGTPILHDGPLSTFDQEKVFNSLMASKLGDNVKKAIMDVHTKGTTPGGTRVTDTWKPPASSRASVPPPHPLSAPQPPPSSPGSPGSQPKSPYETGEPSVTATTVGLGGRLPRPLAPPTPVYKGVQRPVPPQPASSRVPLAPDSAPIVSVRFRITIGNNTLENTIGPLVPYPIYDEVNGTLIARLQVAGNRVSVVAVDGTTILHHGKPTPQSEVQLQVGVTTYLEIAGNKITIDLPEASLNQTRPVRITDSDDVPPTVKGGPVTARDGAAPPATAPSSPHVLDKVPASITGFSQAPQAPSPFESDRPPAPESSARIAADLAPTRAILERAMKGEAHCIVSELVALQRDPKLSRSAFGRYFITPRARFGSETPLATVITTCAIASARNLLKVMEGEGDMSQALADLDALLNAGLVTLPDIELSPGGLKDLRDMVTDLASAPTVAAPVLGDAKPETLDPEILALFAQVYDPATRADDASALIELKSKLTGKSSELQKKFEAAVHHKINTILAAIRGGDDMEFMQEILLDLHKNCGLREEMKTVMYEELTEIIEDQLDSLFNASTPETIAQAENIKNAFRVLAVLVMQLGLGNEFAGISPGVVKTYLEEKAKQPNLAEQVRSFRLNLKDVGISS